MRGNIVYHHWENIIILDTFFNLYIKCIHIFLSRNTFKLAVVARRCFILVYLIITEGKGLQSSSPLNLEIDFVRVFKAISMTLEKVLGYFFRLKRRESFRLFLRPLLTYPFEFRALRCLGRSRYYL